MANIVRGNSIEINSANQFIFPEVSTGDGKSGKGIKLLGLALVMTTTDAKLQLGYADTLGASVAFQLDKNTTTMAFEGLYMKNLIVTSISAGTGFIYFA